jgi:hypothetical protein
MKLKKLLLFSILFIFSSCWDLKEKKSSRGKAGYVSPSVDKNGRYRSGSVRMPVSTEKNAIKSQNRSRYYYETRGKYRRRSKK